MIRTLPLMVLLLLAPAARAAELTVVGLNGKTLTLTAKDLADLPRASVVAPAPNRKTYEGPKLTAILRLAGAPSGPMLHGAPVRDYVLVTGADGFAALLSLAETDPDMHGGAVILADEVAGAPLPPREGRWRLMIAGDLKESRSVRQVVKIELRAAPAASARAPS